MRTMNEVKPSASRMSDCSLFFALGVNPTKLFFNLFVGLPHLATYIFLNFQYMNQNWVQGRS